MKRQTAITHTNTMQAIPLQGLNYILSLVVPAAVFFSTLIFDDHISKLLSVLLGSVIGGVAVDYIRPEQIPYRNVSKVLCSSLLALAPSFSIVAYFSLEQWEYQLSVGFACGLFSIIFCTVALMVADEQVKPGLTKLIKWFFGRFMDSDKPKNE